MTDPAPAPLPATRLDPRPRQGRLARGLLCLFLAWHATMAVGSMGRDVEPIAALRVALTCPYEKLTGTYQTWTMFAPNAPRETEWLRAYGRSATGRSTRIDVLVGELPPDRVEWIYRREGKYERNLLGEGKGRLRRGWTDWACARERAAGQDYDKITLERVVRDTPPPQRRAEAPRSTWKVQATRLTRNDCPEAAP